jgi:hypothetical protein
LHHDGRHKRFYEDHEDDVGKAERVSDQGQAFFRVVGFSPPPEGVNKEAKEKASGFLARKSL